MCARCKRATRVATFPPRSERGHLAGWRLAAVHHVAAAQRRRVDRHDLGHLRLGRASVFHQHPTGQKLVLGVLGKQCQLGAGRPALVHLDGRNFVSHQAQRRDVRRPAPLAQPRARAADAHHHFGLRHFWLGLGLIGRHLRDHQQSGFARVDAPRLRRKAGLGFPGHRWHAGYFDPTLDHHGGVCGGRRCVHHPHLFGGLRAGLVADGLVQRLHRLVELAPPRQSAPPPTRPPP